MPDTPWQTKYNTTQSRNGRYSRNVKFKFEMLGILSESSLVAIFLAQATSAILITSEL